MCVGFGAAAQAVGDGGGELVEFGDFEDAAGHQVDGDHDGADDGTGYGGVGDGAHGPAAAVAAHGVEQCYTDDAGDDGGPAGADVGGQYGFGAVVAEVAFDQDVGERQLEDVDAGEDQRNQVGQGFHGDERGDAVGQG